MFNSSFCDSGRFNTLQKMICDQFHIPADFSISIIDIHKNAGKSVDLRIILDSQDQNARKVIGITYRYGGSICDLDRGRSVWLEIVHYSGWNKFNRRFENNKTQYPDIDVPTLAAVVPSIVSICRFMSRNWSISCFESFTAFKK